MQGGQGHGYTYSRGNVPGGRGPREPRRPGIGAALFVVTVVALLVGLGLGVGIDNVTRIANEGFTRVSHFLIPEPTPPIIISVANEEPTREVVATVEMVVEQTPTPTPTITPTATPISITIVGGSLSSLSALLSPTPIPTVVPEPTDTPTATPVMPATPTPVPEETSVVTPENEATVTPTPPVCTYSQTVLIGAGKETTPCHTPTPTTAEHSGEQTTRYPSVTPVPTEEPVTAGEQTPQHLLPPNERHLEYKTMMLDMVNKERESAGVPPVELGANNAAQIHAEESYKNCFMSHWGVDGLKPYMRYTLSGGFQSNGENVGGSNFCIPEDTGFYVVDDIEELIAEAVRQWMNSPGHKATMLNKHYRKLNIGLAWGKSNLNFRSVQLFEGDYIEYETRPSIQDSTLSLVAKGKNGIEFNRADDVSVQVNFDPEPTLLTRGQLSRTYCYDGGRLIASIRPQPQGNAWYRDTQWVTSFKSCPDPYAVPADAQPPASQQEARNLWLEAYEEAKNIESIRATVPWITTDGWRARQNTFELSLDMKELLEEYGAGVYTIVLWGQIADERFVISRVPIFYQVEVPHTYVQ